MPVLAAELKSFCAVGAVVPAGRTNGKLMALVAVVHVTLLSQATVGAVCTDVAVVGSSFGEPPPVVNVVDVAVTFQPAPEPVASPMSKVETAVGVWSVPFRVALK